MSEGPRSTSDRPLALVVWTIAVVCIALVWIHNASGIRWGRLDLLLSFVALYLGVWGWNLWTDRYSHEGDGIIHRFGRSLPWLWWLR